MLIQPNVGPWALQWHEWRNENERGAWREEPSKKHRQKLSQFLNWPELVGAGVGARVKKPETDMNVELAWIAFNWPKCKTDETMALVVGVGEGRGVGAGAGAYAGAILDRLSNHYIFEVKVKLMELRLKTTGKGANWKIYCKKN